MYDEALVSGHAAVSVDAIAGLLGAAGEKVSVTDLDQARAANAVSGPMDELFALYDDPVPAAILALDYGGREVSLDAIEDGMGDALDDLGELAVVWEGVKQAVLNAGGEVEAGDYEASLATQADLADAGDAAGLLTESNAGLEVVDALEGVFGG